MRDESLTGRAAFVCRVALGVYIPLALILGNAARAPRLCPLYRLSGRNCPLCGLTRALGLVGRGHVPEAFARYPLPLISTATLALFSIVKTAGRTRQA